MDLDLLRVERREAVREEVRLKRSLLRQCRTLTRDSLRQGEEVVAVVGRGKVSLCCVGASFVETDQIRIRLFSGKA